MRNNVLWLLLGSLITVTLIMSFNFFRGYRNNIDQMLGTFVKYKDESLTTYLSSDTCDYLTDGTRSYYFGELPSDEYVVEINSPGRATIYVYPMDDSTIIRYEPRFGINRTYKKSGYGDFNRLLNALYNNTGNEVFNETIDYTEINK